MGRTSTISLFLSFLVIFAAAQDITQQSQLADTLVRPNNTDVDSEKSDPPPSGTHVANNELKFVKLLNSTAPYKPLPSRFFANLPSLENVTIIASVCSLPEDLFNGSYSLIKVIIKCNTFTQIPENIFANQSKMAFIDLSRNRLESLPSKLFNGTANVRVLRLNHNRLRYIQSHHFKQMVQLQMLKLQHNSLASIVHVQFPQTSQLSHLDVGDNQIRQIEPLLEQFDALQTLLLTNNLIEEMPSLGYGRCTHLKHLDLSRNRIRSLTTADILYIDNRTITIDLTHNKIAEILQNTNDLLCTDSIFVRSTETGRWTWQLNDNPFRCDQSLDCFVSLVHTLPSVGWRAGVITFQTDRLACESPALLRGRLVHELTADDLKSATTTTNVGRTHNGINRAINLARKLFRRYN